MGKAKVRRVRKRERWVGEAVILGGNAPAWVCITGPRYAVQQAEFSMTGAEHDEGFCWDEGVNRTDGPDLLYGANWLPGGAYALGGSASGG